MNIFVAGGTGFVGSFLVPYLLRQGHNVQLLIRPNISRRYSIPRGAEVVNGDPLRKGPWWDALTNCEAAINLVGESVTGRWTDKKKALIRESRLSALWRLIDAIPKNKEFTLLSASAVGIYGDAGERELDESAPIGHDFLANVAREWEGLALRAKSNGTRVIVTRFGVVLGPRGGVVEEMAKGMKRFVGGILGPGTQWVSWIHQADLARAICFLLENPDSAGTYNVCSPNPVRQADLARNLGRLINRQPGFPNPVSMVRLALGGFADVVLSSQKMVPKALLDTGFSFRFPTLEEALNEIVSHENLR